MASTILKAAGAAIALLLTGGTSWAACPAPAFARMPGLQFYADIQPTDGVLDVWCRLQAVLPKGTYDMKIVMFADKKGIGGKAFRAERVFRTVFDKDNPQPRDVLAGYIQSLIPTDPTAKSVDPDGQPFPAALERTVQGAAPSTPDGQGLGIPRKYAPSKALALWMPIQIKVRPIKMYGQDFYVAATFKPSVGRLLMATTGSAEQFILKAATNKVMPYKDFMSCNEYVPDCKGYTTEMVDLQTAWTLESVGVASEAGNGLSATAKTLIDAVAAGSMAQDRNSVILNTMRNFSPPDGTAELQVQGPTRELTIKAEGDPLKASGTQTIRMLWTERQGIESTDAAKLEKWTKDIRDRMVLSQGPTAQQGK